MKKIAIALVALAGTACAALAVTVAVTPSAKPTFGAWGIDLTAMDTSVKPGDDFFLYANGSWLSKVGSPRRPHQHRFVPESPDPERNRMKELVAELEARDPATLNPEEKQLRDLYDAFTDTKQIEARGLDPIKPDLARIAALSTPDDVATLMGEPGFPADSIVGTGINPDAKNTNVYVVTAAQSGLGMPDRDYYLRDDPALAATREAYKKYLAAMLTIAGDKDAQARAAAVYALEAGIATAHWAVAERRNADKTYNPMTVTELGTIAPGFPWTAFFKAQGIDAGRKVIVRENTAFPALAQLFAKTPHRRVARLSDDPLPAWNGRLSAQGGR